MLHNNNYDVLHVGINYTELIYLNIKHSEKKILN
jgi:hypothetical protein